MENRFYSFVGTAGGEWRVTSVAGVVGESLEPAAGLEVQNTYVHEPPPGARWVLRGVTSNQR